MTELGKKVKLADMVEPGKILRIGERVIAIIHSETPIRCCGGNTFYLIKVNGGYTTECTCGMYCGQWFPGVHDAVMYFLDMVERANERYKEYHLE